ncbi:MAG: zf-HC2 domain-containing protein [Bryobacteraceae bacterium]
MSEEVTSGTASPVTGAKESVRRGGAPSEKPEERAVDGTRSSSSLRSHPSEELLEQYCLGRVTDPELTRLEEHLLRCPGCCTRAEDMDEYIVAMKVGLAEAAGVRPGFDSPESPEPIRPIILPVPPEIGKAWHSRSALSTLQKIAAVIVFAFSATIAWNAARRAEPVAEAPVSLVALRGAEASLSSVPAGRPIRLDIDPHTLSVAREYRAQVVSASGREVWSGTASLTDQKLSFHMEERLTAGDYWVRLYSADSRDGELLREFALLAH